MAPSFQFSKPFANFVINRLCENAISRTRRTIYVYRRKYLRHICILPPRRPLCMGIGLNLRSEPPSRILLNRCHFRSLPFFSFYVQPRTRTFSYFLPISHFFTIIRVILWPTPVAWYSFNPRNFRLLTFL